MCRRATAATATTVVEPKSAKAMHGAMFDVSISPRPPPAPVKIGVEPHGLAFAGDCVDGALQPLSVAAAAHVCVCHDVTS